MLRRLAIECQACVILTAHVSNEGLSSGSGLSGNRAWSNSVRSRFYLTMDKPETKGGEPATDRRVLRGMKANYAASGGKIPLRWRAGVFERNDPAPPRDYTEPSFAGNDWA